MTRPHLLFALPLALAACSVRDRPEARFHGQLTPSATLARCPATDATLLVRDGKLVFTPDQGTWVLEGTATADTLAAKRSRPTPDHKSYDTELQAHWNPSEVHGAYTTPFCTYRVDLTAY